MENVKTRILLVEDDPNLGTLLQEYLEAKGFETKLATDGKKGFDAFCKQEFDLLLLDVMMPVKDGLTLAKDIRVTEIRGLETGADDYITKPFSMDELLARVTAVVRRSSKQRVHNTEDVNFTIGSYTFNSETQALIHVGKEQKLTTKESQLMRLLCVHKNDVLDKEETIELPDIYSIQNSNLSSRLKSLISLVNAEDKESDKVAIFADFIRKVNINNVSSKYKKGLIKLLKEKL